MIDLLHIFIPKKIYGVMVTNITSEIMNIFLQSVFKSAKICLKKMQEKDFFVLQYIVMSTFHVSLCDTNAHR